MMTDPIADMLTRIRNGLNAKHPEVIIPASRIKKSIAMILKEEGFLANVEIVGEGLKQVIVAALKYTPSKKSVISEISRTSKLGRRVYLGKDEIRSVRHGRGIAILSTSKGVMKNVDAKKHGVGGELLCIVW